MSQLSADEIRQLNGVANELREVFAERGHRIDVALGVDPAFTSRGALTRDLVVEGAGRGASHAGLDFRSVNGSGREFRTISGITERRFRLRRGRRRPDGELVVAASADSALAGVDEDSLLHQEQWVVVWVASGEDAVGEILVAQVIGYSEGRPGHLKLGPAIPLGTAATPIVGFVPEDEELDGFELDEDGENFGPSA